VGVTARDNRLLVEAGPLPLPHGASVARSTGAVWGLSGGAYPLLPLGAIGRVVLSQADTAQGRFVRVDSRPLADQQAVCGWLKGFEHDVLLVSRVSTNNDARTDRSSLVCRDLASASPISIKL
jgi:hypothetical protein